VRCESPCLGEAWRLKPNCWQTLARGRTLCSCTQARLRFGAAIPISLLYWGMATTLEWHALSPSGPFLCLKNSP
jgi:hypothetical protein